MVFYFSATGNSRHIAKKIAEKTNDNFADITDCLKYNTLNFIAKKGLKIGFVFPVLEDKQTNIYKTLYYTKNLENNYSELVNALFAKEAPMPAKEQKCTFGEVLSEAVGDECSLRLVSSIHAQLNEIIEENKNEKEDELPFIDKKDAGDMLRYCGISEEKITAFEEEFDKSFGENAEISPTNLSGTKQLQIETPEATVKVNAGCSGIVQSRIIDGVKYILIRADNDVTVNGVSVKI
jgi:flavodoxin